MTLGAAHSPDDGHLVRGSAWVMAGFVAQAVTGIVFWLLATRNFASHDVGRAAAVFASLQFVNYATAMGLQEMLARFHHEPGSDRDCLFAWSLVVTATTSAIGTVAFLTTVTSVTDVLRAVGSVGGGLLFFAISAGAAIALLTDVRFMATRRWGWVFGRLVIVGAARIPALWLPAPGDDALWLFLVMAVPIAVSGLIGVVVLRATAGLQLSLRPLPHLSRQAVRYAAVNYASHLALLGPQFALPVIVLVNVGPTENANFFLAWSIAAVASILPVTIARVLVVEATRPRADLDRHVRRALVLALAVMALATAVTAALSPLIGAVYGDAYREAGRLLPTLVAASMPWAVTTVALGHSRVRHDPVGTVVMTAALAASILGLAIAWVPDTGSDGAAQAWMVGNLVAATVALAMWRRARRLPVAVAATPLPSALSAAAGPLSLAARAGTRTEAGTEG